MEDNKSIKVINPSNNATSYRVSNLIDYTIHTWKICNYALNELPKVLKNLNIHKWCIGGSVAGILYGSNFNRVPHDIDVIVPVGTLTEEFVKLLKENPLIRIPDQGTSSTDNEHTTKHLCFEVIGGFTIDLIENIIGEKLEAIRACRVLISTPKSLIEAKRCYHRSKDKEDLLELEDLLTKINHKGIKWIEL